MTKWQIWWLCWFIVSFGSFLAVEIYALCTKANRTLSEAVWALEELRTGQSIDQWSFSHLAFMSVYTFVAVWLFFHFGFHWWR